VRDGLLRRDVLSLGSAAILAGLYSPAAVLATEYKDTKMVGAYMPESAEAPGFHVFTATPTRTPALRALALEPYQMLVPGTWKEAPVSNARSGNYCQVFRPSTLNPKFQTLILKP